MSTYVTKLAKAKGLKIVDATEPLWLEVNPKDIKKALKGNSRHCGFAECIMRQDPGVDAAYVFRSTAYVEREGKMVRYVLPQSMQKEIVAFDRNKSMDPGEYKMVPPSKSISLAEVHKRSKKRPGRHQPAKVPTGIKRRHHRMTGIRSMKDPEGS